MSLLIVGCGPKALALLAKAEVLKHNNIDVPEIFVLEKNQVAANWCGQFGFTDGQQSLGTSPEKDIGFPYASQFKDRVPSIDQDMQSYSWQSFKIERGEFADWVDRNRPAPSHVEWASYLKWAGQKAGIDKPGVKLEGELFEESITFEDGRWRVAYRPTGISNSFASESAEITVDGIVFTGPGTPKAVAVQSNHANVLNGETLWTHLLEIDQLRNGKIAIIGAGETAASAIVRVLHTTNGKNLDIHVISRRGTLFSRGEGFHENRYFSDPTGWQALPPRHRTELIERTDRGVLSQRAIQIISNARNVKHFPGEVTKIWGYPKATLEIIDGTETKLSGYDFVVVALGFNAMAFHKCFAAGGPEGLMGLIEKIKAEYKPKAKQDKGDQPHKDFFLEMVKQINSGLRLGNIKPRVYLPMLAGFQEGPGFPNLSCLGILSDRILYDLISK